MRALKKFGLMFVDSAISFKDLHKLTLISLFVALVVIGNSIKITIAPQLEIRFSFVFMTVTAFIFGPVVACVAGIFSDLLGFIINPTGMFHIGFTINAALGGLIYGVCLYKRRIDSPYFIVFIVISKALVNFVINITLTPIWLAMMAGRTAGQILTLPRLYKNIVALPIEIIIIFVVIKAVSGVLEKADFFRIKQ